MKNLILTLAVCFSAASAFAGHEGPNAAQAPHLPPSIIAEVSQGSMFHPPQAPSGRIVDVFADGRVVLTEMYDGGKVQRQQLAILSEAVLAKLRSSVNGVSESELIDPSPSSGECMDAPSTTYIAFKNISKKVIVGQNMGCKELRGKNPNAADATVLNTLKALFDLSWIASSAD